MTPEELKKRSKKFAVEIINLIDLLPPNKTGDVIGKQLMRSATSVGANYRAACKAKSRADFICKINIVEEEADESQYWLEIIQELQLLPDAQCVRLLREAQELSAIFAASATSAKRNR